MAENYKWITFSKVVQRLSDGAFIPNDLGNKDWLSFQIWLTGGNTPTAADPSATPATILSDERAAAINTLLTDTSPLAKEIRALILLILDEFNIVRPLLTTPQAVRTIAQLKTALQTKLSNGAAD